MKLVTLSLLSLVLLLAACSETAMPAEFTPPVEPQITNGDVDGDGHPYVGLMIALDEDGDPLSRCSGTLLSPTLYLTAGHCTDEAASVEIWFDSGPIELAEGFLPEATCEGVTGYPCVGDVGGTPYLHPDYDPSAFFLYDLSVVVLDEPIEMDEYGTLPELDQLDALKPSRRTIFTAVGYGLQEAYPAAAGFKTVAVRERMVAYPHLLQINRGIVGDYAMLLSNNANTGGTCFGDSGGPNFLGDTNVIAGVTSFGLNSTCGGTGGVYRIDRADDLEWLETFLD